MIEVILDSPNGPKVVADNSDTCEAILAELPEGWTVAPDDWCNGVPLTLERWAYPLSRAECHLSVDNQPVF